MNTQPYELKVADLLDAELRRSHKLNTLYAHAAAEIRRLHEENEKLRAALAKAQGELTTEPPCKTSSQCIGGKCERCIQPAQPEQEIELDRDHVENDGCPTEKAVLQRFWREHQKQEPVAWVCESFHAGEKHSVDFDQDDVDALPVGTKLYTAPPQRKWQGLTDEEKLTIVRETDNPVDALAATEAKLKEKNK